WAVRWFTFDKTPPETTGFGGCPTGACFLITAGGPERGKEKTYLKLTFSGDGFRLLDIPDADGRGATGMWFIPKPIPELRMKQNGFDLLIPQSLGAWALVKSDPWDYEVRVADPGPNSILVSIGVRAGTGGRGMIEPEVHEPAEDKPH